MPKKPIRIIEGESKPHARFWNWVPRAESDPDSQAEIQFYGYISEYSWWDDDITPAKFREDLAKYGAGGPITVRIHSGGGDVWAASAIRAMLSDYDAHVTCRIDGLCASAAVAVALAGDEIIIQDSAYMMIHNPGYTMLWGWMNAETLRELSAHLDKTAESLVDIYAKRTGLPKDDVIQMMGKETWMTAQNAVDFGFADRMATGGKIAESNPSVQNLIQNCVNPPKGLLSPPRLSAQAELLRTRVRTILNPF